MSKTAGTKRRAQRRAKVVYTNTCARADVHRDWPAHIPDDQELCDWCLLAKYGLDDHVTTNPCNDPYGMHNLYPEKVVVRALRRAEKGKSA